ncbi:sigma factor-like helix-turn-helix DNA-binding protein [Clostridiaceae bacterium M8S5]|nr:sigma factor-like helix-turn-helix DNA-binding protein [Clostridiaceae bacterium M8S5]
MCKSIHRKSELNIWKDKIELTDELVECFDEFRKEEANHQKWVKRYISNVPLSQIENQIMQLHQQSVEEIACNNIIKQQLYKALSMLTIKQRRRIIMKYYDNKSVRRIAKEEGIHFTKVHKSIRKAERKITKFIKNLDRGGTKSI